MKFFTHPGTWTFLALLAVGMGIAFPIAAPALIVVALIFTVAATVSLIPYAIRYVQKLRKEAKAAGYLEDTSIFKIAFDKFKQWAKDHPMQAFLVGLGLALFVTALVLTIGFFTGGGALVVVAGGAVVATGGGMFAFMAPVFAAIAAPFAAAAAAAGVAIADAAFVAAAIAVFTLAALNVTNTAKRIFAWLDGFRLKGHGHVEYAVMDDPDKTLGQRISETLAEGATYLSEVRAGMSRALFAKPAGHGRHSDDESPLIELGNRNDKL